MKKYEWMKTVVVIETPLLLSCERVKNREMRKERWKKKERIEWENVLTMFTTTIHLKLIQFSSFIWIVQTLTGSSSIQPITVSSALKIKKKSLLFLFSCRNSCLVVDIYFAFIFVTHSLPTEFLFETIFDAAIFILSSLIFSSCFIAGAEVLITDFCVTVCLLAICVCWQNKR